MEIKENNDKNMGQDNKDPQPKKSWVERNLWWIAVGLAIFCVRMCHALAR